MIVKVIISNKMIVKVIIFKNKNKKINNKIYK